VSPGDGDEKETLTLVFLPTSQVLRSERTNVDLLKGEIEVNCKYAFIRECEQLTHQPSHQPSDFEKE
jgi:hypothetical protein